MAAGKPGKRVPSSYVTATIIVFIGLCLIGMWILSSPSEQEVSTEVESMPVKKPQQFEDNTSRHQENEQTTDQQDSNQDQETETEVKEESSQQTDDVGSETSETTTSSEESTEETKESTEETKESTEESKESIEETKETTEETKETTEESKESITESEIREPEKSSDDGTLNSEPEENGAAQSEIQIENKETSTTTFETQASESKEEKEVQQGESGSENTPVEEQKPAESTESEEIQTNDWELCSFEGAQDYIPCLDNKEAIKKLTSTKHYEHRERHCPTTPPTCLVPLPEGYKSPIPWPKSRNEIWYSNVPHPGLVSYKKDQNWVKKSGEKLIFPGGGTQFKHGAMHYIDYLEKTLPDIAWGKRTRVILDVGCGVASFGGYIYDKDVLTMSFAPKDEHEAQIQLALERGIPAISEVMGTQRLPFPSNVYDAIHCARCRVPWHAEGGKLLLELNRVLRPGGYFLWSATPVYWKDDEDVGIWKAMSALTAAMCWELVAKTKDSSTGVGVAIYHKPTSNFCYENRKETSPPLCEDDDKSDAAWYIPMNACMHKIPSGDSARGVEWPQEWPLRLTSTPSWLGNEKGFYGKPAAADFRSDMEHWQRVVQKSYLQGLGIDWNNIRNVMDMKSVYGGFAAALASQSVWVMNVVPYDAPDTLPVIFDRGLFGIYHDWCESFNTYPRTYDLLHSDHLFDKLKKRCDVKSTVAEMDRLLRPNGWVIFRERLDTLNEIEKIVKSLHWEIRTTYSKDPEGLMVVQKTLWRPQASS